MSSLVSVIIPTFNRSQHVKRAVESVLAQTHENFEVLVIDDGSTDSTRETITGILDKRVRYIYTPNRGNYFARNEGLKAAKGEFIAFLDSDDTFLPQKLSRQLEQFQMMGELGLCCSNLYIRHENLSDKVFEDRAHAFACDFGTDNGFIQQALKSNFIATSTVVIRKSCVENIGHFDTRFQNAMDYEFFLRIIFNFPAKYLKEKLVERLIHPVAVSRNSVITANALVYIFSECRGRFEKGGLFLPAHKEFLEKARERSIYLLGMEQLVAYSFDAAYDTLKKCQYKQKALFKGFALLTARFRLGFLVFMIAQYRKTKNYFSLHYNPTVSK